MNLILSSRGQWLKASLSQCWSRLANEVGSPRFANDILVPCQFSFFCQKLYVGIEPQSCAHSPNVHFFWWSVSYSHHRPWPPGWLQMPLPTLPSSWAAEFINWSVLRQDGGAGEGTGVRKGSDSICFVPGSKQRGYCLLIDCFWKAAHMGPGEFQR